MLTYGLYCTVCRKGTIGRKVWLKHLTEECHQSLARVEWIQWDKALRKRSLVCYNFPQEDADQLVHVFSNDRTLVSDFVCGVDKPTVAIIQLEDEEAVHLAILGNGTKFSITRDCQVRLQRADELTDYQWAHLLEPAENDSDTPSESDGSHSLPMSKPSCSTKLLASPTVSVNRSHCPLTNGSSPAVTDVLLSAQVKSIYEALKVPDDKYTAAQNIVEVLQTLLQTLLRNQYGRVSVNMFRNWNLQFRHEYSDYLLIHVTTLFPCENSLTECSKGGKVGKLPGRLAMRAIRNLILNSEDGKRLFPNVLEVVVRKENRLELGIGNRFEFRSSRFSFNLIGHDSFLIEVQLSRLLQYLSSFDERCVPLLSLVHQWAKSHEIMLQESMDLLVSEVSFYNLGDPAALEWMVILFMCRKGLIPSPREIQARAHCPVIHPGTLVDVGFSEDIEFAAEWRNNKHPRETTENTKENLALSVVTLAQQFFSMFANALASGSWILNTRDGKLVSTHELLSKGTPIPAGNPVSSDSAIGFSETEVNILKTIHMIDENKVKQIVSFDDLTRFRVFVINPLCIRWRLSLSNRKLPAICQAMKKTSESLKVFVEMKKGQRQECRPLRDYLNPAIDE